MIQVAQFKYTHLNEETYDELFRVRRCTRYHNHRRRFFESWNAITVALGALAATSVSWVVLTGATGWFAGVPAVFAMASGILSAVDLAVGTARQASLHADLSTRYTLLEKYFVKNDNLSPQALAALRAEQVQLRSLEPPILRLLDATCHYEVLRSFGGDPNKHPSIKWLRRFFVHIFSQPTYARSLLTKGASTTAAS